MPHLTRLLIAASAVLLMSLPARASIISDFGSASFPAQLFPPMGLTWNNLGTDQYVQDIGSITIAPVGGGNPRGDGYFYAGLLPTPGTTTVDFTGFDGAFLSARVEAGNASSIVKILFYDSTFNTAAPVAEATFQTTSFSTSIFTLIQAPLVFTGSGNPADIAYWRVEGDDVPSNDFRYSLDSLHVASSVIPEPRGFLLLGLGLGALVFFRRPKK